MHAFPSISEDEFASACRELENMCEDKLSGTTWTSVKWQDHELRIRQKKPADNTEISQMEEDLETDRLDETDKVSHLALLVMNLFDSFQEMLPRVTSQNLPNECVTFSIVLSPTYRVPTLWFNFASYYPARVVDLGKVYSQIVSPLARGSLGGIGVMGGISIANHPISDIPSFFIHPCNTPEALVAVKPSTEINPFGYLMLWFGIIGSAVGLHVPSRVMSKDGP